MTITLLTPCHDGMYHSNYNDLLLGSQRRYGLMKSEYESDIIRHRSKMVSKWLTDPQFSKSDGILFMDADVGGPGGYIDRMASLPDDIDIISGVYVKKDGSYTPVLRGLTEDRHPCDPNIVRCECVPTGFTRYSRRVLQAVYDTKHDPRAMDDWRLVFHARPLSSSVTGPGKVRYESEDYAFCLDAAALGYRVWVDRTIRLSHRGSKTFQA